MTSQTALSKELSRVKRKQAGAVESSVAVCNALLEAVRHARAHNTPPDVPDDVLGASTTASKEFAACVGRLGKAIEQFAPDPPDVSCRAWFSRTPLDHSTLKQAVALRLMRAGCFEAADLLASPSAGQRRPAFVSMHAVVSALRVHDVAPALAWTEDHAAELQQRRSLLPFALHRLQFLELLQHCNAAEAVAYARKHLSGQRCSSVELARLMGTLPHAAHLASSPYADLVHPRVWDSAAQLFTSECCVSMGLAPASGLDDVLCAGTAALPVLLKMAALLAAKGTGAWNRVTQLPVEVNLPSQFAYDSVLCCPVSRDACGPDNPPYLLPCGLVLGKLSIAKLARGNGRAFRCPYCPLDIQGAAPCAHVTWAACAHV